jgi:type IX secretion system PorP/SprF family membrane protein
MRTRIIIFVMLFTGFGVYAQQDAQYTHYMYNTANINPAYAGSRECLSVFALGRTQWVGLDGAPNTATFAISSPIAGTNLGVGLAVIDDRIGPAVEDNVSADLSYTIPTSETYKLSFGVKGSINFLNIDFFNKTNAYNKFDPNLADINNKFKPNVGAGIYLHSDKTYFGVSVPNFLETKHYDTTISTNAIARERMNFYAIAGHVFDLSETIQFKPAVLAKVVTGAPLQIDVTGNLMFNEKFVLGLAYRWSAALSGLVGFQANQSWFIGYGYDWETTKLAGYNSGSHEIFLRYELFNKYDRIVSPRFF